MRAGSPEPTPIPISAKLSISFAGRRLACFPCRFADYRSAYRRLCRHFVGCFPASYHLDLIYDRLPCSPSLVRSLTAVVSIEQQEMYSCIQSEHFAALIFTAFSYGKKSAKRSCGLHKLRRDLLFTRGNATGSAVNKRIGMALHKKWALSLRSQAEA